MGKEYSKEFLAFWKEYPKKVGKDYVFKCWQKRKPILAEVLAAIKWQKTLKDWTKDDGQFIPNPSTYINQGRWKDEMPPEIARQQYAIKMRIEAEKKREESIEQERAEGLKEKERWNSLTPEEQEKEIQEMRRMADEAMGRR